jgi:flagellar biosynthesis component FlhA
MKKEYRDEMELDIYNSFNGEVLDGQSLREESNALKEAFRMTYHEKKYTAEEREDSKKKIVNGWIAYMEENAKKDAVCESKAMKSRVMRIAWAIRKTAAEEYGCKVSEISMSKCMKMAWADVKNN